MSSYIGKEMGIEMAKWVLGIVGTVGPVRIDVGINDHNESLETFNDEFTIGDYNRIITLADCINFLDKLDAYAGNSEFDNGRSYCFEGISESEDDYNGSKKYYIHWGS